jgi:hypothetical protein
MVHDAADRFVVAFDDERVVANAGVMLPAWLARRLGIEALVDDRVDHAGRVSSSSNSVRVEAPAPAQSSSRAHASVPAGTRRPAEASRIRLRLALGRQCGRRQRLARRAVDWASAHKRVDAVHRVVSIGRGHHIVDAPGGERLVSEHLRKLFGALATPRARAGGLARPPSAVRSRRADGRQRHRPSALPRSASG